MRSEARQTVIPHLNALISAQFSDFDVFYENGPAVDFANQTRPFVMIEIQVGDGVQASLEQKPMVRYLADVVICAFVKMGEGTDRQEALLDAAGKDLRTRYLGELVMLAPKSYRPREYKGFYGKAIRVPFTFDEFS